MPEDAAGEDLIVLLDEQAVVRRRQRRRREPTTTLAVTIPAPLAEGLKQALAVLPGLDLDDLAAAALERALASHPQPVARRRSTRGDDQLVVLL